MTFAEKLKLIRKANNLTQAEFAASIGISRGNLSGLELGKVEPTQVLINCVSLMYNIDKKWLTDENNNDLGALNGSTNLLSIITEKYDQLNDRYKKFVENQIKELLSIQESQEPSKPNDGRKSNKNIDSETSEELEINKEVEDYRHELELEKSTATSQASPRQEKKIG